MSTLSQFFGAGGGGMPDLAPAPWQGDRAISDLPTSLTSDGWLTGWRVAVNSSLAATDVFEDLVNVSGAGVLHGVLHASATNAAAEMRVTIDGGTPIIIAKPATASRAIGLNTIGFVCSVDGATLRRPVFLPNGNVRFNTSLRIERKTITGTGSTNVWWAAHYSLDA